MNRCSLLYRTVLGSALALVVTVTTASAITNHIPTPRSMPGCTIQAQLSDNDETVPANGTKFISLKLRNQIAGASSVPGDPVKVVTYTARVKPGVKGIKLCGILPSRDGNFVRSGVTVHLTPRSLTASIHALASEGTGAVVFAKRVN